MNSKILILGASSDIGIELVKILLNTNLKVFAHCSKNSKKLKLLPKKKNNLILITKNFSNLSEKEFNTFLRKKLNLNFTSLINLIGYVDKKNYFNTSLSSLIRSLKINSIYPMFITRYLIKKMIKKKFGRIVNCSSIGVKFGGGRKTFNYSYSKNASEFIPGIYKEWAKKNILINNIRIGLCDTKLNRKNKEKRELKSRIKLIPMQRISTPKEIANYLYFFISEKNSYITNQNISISGGE